MRAICFLFFTIVSLGAYIHKSAADVDEERLEAIVDTRVVDYDETEDVEPERPVRKERIKAIKNFVGTNLFGEGGCRKKCFSMEDIALLASRRDFESLIPKDLPNCLLDNDLVKILMQYFYGANQVIDKMASGHTKVFAQKAFYDTLGGYLKYYMIPISRFSYYAGLVKLRTVQNVLELYSECKIYLNTNGNGWRPALSDLTDTDTQIEPLRIFINSDDEDTSCIQLDLLDERTGEEDDMIVALPRLDPEEKGFLGNVWMPFKRKRTFNLQSCMSAFVLVRYFELATRCYTFQGICQDTFNKRLKSWILENLEIHFGDDVLYPGLGAILRIVETLRRNNKGTVTVLSKQKGKRQKTQQYKSLEKNAKQLHNEGWVDGVFGATEQDVLDEYIETAEKKKDQARRMHYVYVIIGIVTVVLLVLFIGILITLYKMWQNKKNSNDECDGTKPKEKTKCPWFSKKKKSDKDDEEVLIESKGSSKKPSKSKLSTKQTKSSESVKKSESGTKAKRSKKDTMKSCSSTSSSSPEKPKCFGICMKNDSPTKMDTTSIASDSDKEDEHRKKEPSKHPPTKTTSKTTKATTVDEKKRFSISKKHKPKDPATAEKPAATKKKKET